jgi:hypothetical protein
MPLPSICASSRYNHSMAGKRAEFVELTVRASILRKPINVLKSTPTPGAKKQPVNQMEVLIREAPRNSIKA